MSTKTVFLYVSGGDYAALDFTRKYVPHEFYEQMIEREEQTAIIDDEMYAEISIFEFDGLLPEEAVNFIKEKIGDYDRSKDSDLFWICVK